MNAHCAALVFALFCFVSGTALEAPPAAEPGPQPAVSESIPEPEPIPATAPEVTPPPIGNERTARDFPLRNAPAAITYIGPDIEICRWIRDEETATQLAEAFSNLSPGPAERIPLAGSPSIIVHLNLAGERRAYAMQSPDDGVLYCKDALADELSSATGWLVVPDAKLYDRLVEFCFTNPIPK